MDMRIDPTSSAQINSVGTTPAIDPAETKPAANTTATKELSRFGKLQPVLRLGRKGDGSA